jgi:hypothetical protein
MSSRDPQQRAREWEVILREILGGQHADSIARLGSAAAFARAAMQAESDDALDEITARSSLASLLVQWRIGSAPKEYRARIGLRLVELIAEFMPSNGAGVIAELLSSSESWMDEPTSHARHLRRDTVRSAALSLMGLYYRTPPHGYAISDSAAHGAYSSYVAILRAHLARDECVVEAAVQLVLLDEVHVDDEWPLKLGEDRLELVVRRVLLARDVSAGLSVMETIFLLHDGSAFDVFWKTSHSIHESYVSQRLQFQSLWGSQQ